MLSWKCYAEKIKQIKCIREYVLIKSIYNLFETEVFNIWTIMCEFLKT